MDHVDLEAQSENIDLENAINVDIELDEDMIKLEGSDLNKLLKKKRLKSKVWEFFDVLLLGPYKKLKSAYKKCGHQYLASSKYGTGNMLKHIKTCPRTETRDIGQMLITRDTGSNVTPPSSKKKGKGKATQIMDVDESDLFKEFDDVPSDSFSSK
ncbi:hypothetical protein TIFTF001_036047 [Ficus carica]|uniref:BED-type domain-containing protein n=1 Tax=Ficus carica TaxID=3494 RepID=A0AA88JCD2_FICCA|nr:hypothetical protein TIFTF001_036047 [Ficus carica]